MNILIIVLEVIGALILLLLVAAAFASDDYKVESSIPINKPVPQVFEYVKYLKNQANYNKWVMADPNVRKEFKGTDGTEGFFYAWDSDNKQVGKGEQTIKQIIDGKIKRSLSGRCHQFIGREGGIINNLGSGDEIQPLMPYNGATIRV